MALGHSVPMTLFLFFDQAFRSVVIFALCREAISDKLELSGSDKRQDGERFISSFGFERCKFHDSCQPTGTFCVSVRATDHIDDCSDTFCVL